MGFGIGSSAFGGNFEAQGPVVRGASFTAFGSIPASVFPVFVLGPGRAAV